jgi:hypothetical protein
MNPANRLYGVVKILGNIYPDRGFRGFTQSLQAI